MEQTNRYCSFKIRWKLLFSRDAWVPISKIMTFEGFREKCPTIEFGQKIPRVSYKNNFSWLAIRKSDRDRSKKVTENLQRIIRILIFGILAFLSINEIISSCSLFQVIIWDFTALKYFLSMLRETKAELVQFQYWCGFFLSFLHSLANNNNYSIISNTINTYSNLACIIGILPSIISPWRFFLIIQG